MRDRVATPQRDVWPALHRLVRRVVAARPEDADELAACGVSCEGPIDAIGGTVSPLHLPVWQSFELRDRVERADRPADGARAGGQGRVLAERWKGAAADVTDVMVLLMSDAVEAGIISNDRLLHGRLGNAGQLGHVVVEPDGLACVCGGTGCLTSYVSSSAIEDETNRPLRRAPASVIERAGVMIGRAVASAVAVFDLRLVVLDRFRPGGVRPDAARRGAPRARPAQPHGPRAQRRRPQRAPRPPRAHDARPGGAARRCRGAGAVELGRGLTRRRGDRAVAAFTTVGADEPDIRSRGRRLPRQGAGVPGREAADELAGHRRAARRRGQGLRRLVAHDALRGRVPRPGLARRVRRRRAVARSSR